MRKLKYCFIVLGNPEKLGQSGQLEGCQAASLPRAYGFPQHGKYWDMGLFGGLWGEEDIWQNIVLGCGLGRGV